MKTFKAYFSKEIMESIRHYRYIVLAAGIIVFAILDPVMLKLLPNILKNQVAGDIDLSALFNITPSYALANYIKDLNQIGIIFIIFTLGGILSEEITGQKLVFPYSSGSRPGGIVLAKVVHYVLAVSIFTFIGFLTAWYYIGILFTGDMPRLWEVMNSAVLISLYYMYTITLVTFLSSFFKKGIGAGFTVLILNFVMIGLSKLKGIGEIIPYKLIENANLVSFEGAEKSIIFVILISIIFVWGTIYRMNRVEVI